VRLNLSVVLICIFFMARDGEHVFMCFLVIWVFSLEKVMFSSVAHFFIVFCGDFFNLDTISFFVQELFNFMYFLVFNVMYIFFLSC
jgi:hypothetical protein